jgi:hypothetical protein
MDEEQCAVHVGEIAEAAAAAAGTTSFTSTVPAAVPSLFQSSSPFTKSLAVKKQTFR